MLLQNFDHHVTALMLSTYHSASSVEATAATANVSVKNTYGSIVSACPTGVNLGGYYGLTTLPFGYNTIAIGNGDTPVTYGDFRLAGDTIGSTFTNISNTITFDEDQQCWIRTLTVKYSNTEDTDFIVKEWGIWRNKSGAVSGAEYSNNSNNCYLVYREVLDEPTIAANSTATLTFTLKVPHEMNAF